MPDRETISSHSIICKPSIDDLLAFNKIKNFSMIL